MTTDTGSTPPAYSSFVIAGAASSPPTVRVTADGRITIWIGDLNVYLDPEVAHVLCGDLADALLSISTKAVTH